MKAFDNMLHVLRYVWAKYKKGIPSKGVQNWQLPRLAQQHFWPKSTVLVL